MKFLWKIILIILITAPVVYARDVTEIKWPLSISAEKIITSTGEKESIYKDEHTEYNKDILPPAAPSFLSVRTNSALRESRGGTVSLVRYILEFRREPTDTELEILKNLNCKIEVQVFNMVQLLIPVEKIEIIKGLNFIKNFRLPSDVEENSRIIHSVAFNKSEEFSPINLEEAHKLGYLGQNVRIAILDTAFDPAHPFFHKNIYYTLSFRSQNKNIRVGNIEHGNAVTEIVTTVAPGAKIILANFETDVEYMRALKELINQPVYLRPNIIVTAVNIILPDDYYDGSGIRARLAHLARQKGITLVSSAGNNAQTHYMGKFFDSNGNDLHNFTNKDDSLEIDVKRGDKIRIVLAWKDNWNNPGEDLDLGFFDDNLDPLQISDTKQTRTKAHPYELIEMIAPYSGTYHIAIKKGIKVSNNLPFMIYVYSISADNMEYFNPETSLDPGLPTAVDGITVGAVQNLYPYQLEPWSSQGKTTDNRIKPDIVAPGGIYCKSIQNMFSGTSAATPQVAGALALLLSKNPSLNPYELKKILKNTAQDLGMPGEDPVFGSGLLNIYKALLY
ncbi:MAG TPA: S8 family serine peptidase [Candidatus Eremiobacteraeota bacterium]|nr:MAG: Subtilisin BL [bacterium ADurb.Bin363]HPZ06584.1 S8 family serine peptidase [Candidatus Eremiobacteraeota bacterium]